jgi:beta-xylosidase
VLVNARRLVMGAAIVMVVVGLASCSDPPLATPNSPTFDHDFPDPTVIRDGTTLRAYATNVGLTTTPTISSAAVGGPWNPAPTYPSAACSFCYGYPNTADGGDALQTRPAWDTHELGTVWAPAIWQPSAGKYVMYFTDRVNTGFGPRQCIGVATATTARGPYTPAGSGPIVCQADLGGSIDPSVFVTTSGGGSPKGKGKPKPSTTTAYLLFKNDGNCCGMGTFIWSQQLASDGLSVTGSANGLIGTGQDWENGDAGGEPWKNLVEAPNMVYAGGSYYLFYSANWWESSNYAIGYALCTAPNSGCSKPRNGPIMASGDQGAGPGGQDVFADGTGQLWMTYAAWAPNLIGYQPMSNPNWQAYKRSLRFTRISLSGGGISFGAGP